MRGKSLVCLVCFSMLLISMLITNTAQAPVSTRIYVDPSTSTAPPGESFTVDINIDDVTGLSAWEFRMSWNNTVLSFVDATEGPFLASAGLTYFIVTPTPTPPAPAREIIVGCMLKVAASASGSGNLCSLTFSADVEGASLLDIYESHLYDIDVIDIEHAAEDGYFSNIVVGNLVKKSAWPEHHHFKISTDEDGKQTLYGKVKNLGEGYGYLRVHFKIVLMDGPETEAIAKYMVGGVETRIAPGQELNLSVDLEGMDLGKYYVQAKCLYSATGETWSIGAKLKGFSFAVVP